jgi:hypothetical protein
MQAEETQRSNNGVAAFRSWPLHGSHLYVRLPLGRNVFGSSAIVTGLGDGLQSGHNPAIREAKCLVGLRVGDVPPVPRCD